MSAWILRARVGVRPAPDVSLSALNELAPKVHVVMRDGRTWSREESGLRGSPTRPMSWDSVIEKFAWLAKPSAGDTVRAEIVAAVWDLESITSPSWQGCYQRSAAHLGASSQGPALSAATFDARWPVKMTRALARDTISVSGDAGHSRGWPPSSPNERLRLWAAREF